MRLIEFLKWKFTPAIICLNVAYFMVESSIVWRVLLAQFFLIVYKTVSVKKKFFVFIHIFYYLLEFVFYFLNFNGDRSGLKAEPF